MARIRVLPAAVGLACFVSLAVAGDLPFEVRPRPRLLAEGVFSGFGLEPAPVVEDVPEPPAPPSTAPVGGESAVRRVPPPGEGGRPHWRRNLFKRVFTDQEFLVTRWAPAELRRPSVFVTLLVPTAAAAASGGDGGGLDLRLSNSIADRGSGGARPVARGLSRLGDGAAGMALIGGTYFISRWSGHDRMARATSLSAEALLNTALWSSALKRLTARSRPNQSLEGQFFTAGQGQEATSFPSGHAMGAFAVAAVFAGEYRDRKWVRWVAYTTAGLIAASRVALGRHFVSDVVVGAVLGRSLGRMVTAREHGIEESRRRGRFGPIYDPERRGYGVGYHYAW